jgi:hypothetical protein
MSRAFLFPDERLLTPPKRGEPLLAFDPLTGQTEVILDDYMPAEDDEEPLELSLDVSNEKPPDEPFRALVVPRRIRGLEMRAPLVPGGRTNYRDVLRPAFEPVPGGVMPSSAPGEIVLTAFPVRVTAVGAQALELSQDVLSFDELVVELQVLTLSGGGTPDITVELQTGMQVESTSGWISAGAFARVTTAPSVELKSFTQFLRYVRWNVGGLSGTGPSATFFLSVVGRRWSKVA